MAKSFLCRNVSFPDSINILSIFVLKLNYNYILKYSLYWNLTIYFITSIFLLNFLKIIIFSAPFFSLLGRSYQNDDYFINLYYLSSRSKTCHNFKKEAGVVLWTCLVELQVPHL